MTTDARLATGCSPTSPPPFRPLVRNDGYLAIGQHGLIGDGSGSALVATDGTVPWMCIPRFDDDPLFASLLDRRRGGHLLAGPTDVVEARQWYLEDSAVLVTEQRTRDGALRLVDLLPEQIDPSTGNFLGNYPQAFSHVRVLSNAVLLSRHEVGS